MWPWQNGHTLVPDWERGVFHEFLPDGAFRRAVNLGDAATIRDLIYRPDRAGGLLGQLRTVAVSAMDTLTLATLTRTVEGPREVLHVGLEGDGALLST